MSSFHLTHGRDPRIHVDYDVINGPMKESIVAIRLKKKKRKRNSIREKRGKGREENIDLVSLYTLNNTALRLLIIVPGYSLDLRSSGDRVISLNKWLRGPWLT